MPITKKLSEAPALPRLAFSMRETSEIIGVDYQTLYRLHKRGLIRSAGALRTKLFPKSEIERFLRETLTPGSVRTTRGPGDGLT